MSGKVFSRASPLFHRYAFTIIWFRACFSTGFGRKKFGEIAIASCNSFDQRRSWQGRFVLTEGGTQPRPEEEQTAAGGSESVDAVELGIK